MFQELTARPLSERKKIAGIGPRRAEIIVGGTAVFLRVLESLKLSSMYYSSAGVRDGVIADLAARGVGRERSRLNRPQVKMVEGMCRKFNVDVKNAKQVAQLAADLFNSLAILHTLAPDTGKLLEAAAFLHNTGHYISDTGHHKHSAYIVTNSDMPGYTDRERQLVALLCRYHRKSLPSARHEAFRVLQPDEKRIVQMLTPILRIAVGLDAGNEQKVSNVEIGIVNKVVNVTVTGAGDLDLELWAADRAADSFRQIYEVPMNVIRTK